VLGKLNIKIISALNLKNTEWLGKSDPFASCYLSTDPKCKLVTPTKKSELNPIWNFEGSFHINLLRSQVIDAMIVCEIYDKESITKDEIMGKVTIPLIDALEKPDEIVLEDY